MERTINIELRAATVDRRANAHNGAAMFAASVIVCACLAAALASWLPLQLSVVTVFLFAGPHNWFELSYFLMRLPVRLHSGAEQFDGLTSMTCAEARLFSRFRIVDVVDASLAAIKAESLLHSFYEAA